MSLSPQRKHVPSSYKGWLREVEGIERFLKESSSHLEDKGPDWVKNMIKYYRERLAYLKTRKPRTPLDRK